MTTKLETYAISHENSSNELIRETPNSKQETVNSQQLAILKKNFPSCFDKNGAFLPNKLAELVGTETEVSQEFYELNWLGRSYAKYLRNAPPEMLMTEDTEHNAEPINQDSQNLLIQGDNLEVLKHLKNAYAEQVKMIYIDPPYNTGSDGFVYQDDREFTPQQLSELANVPIEEAERILTFTAKGSNSHSAWLTFMYPRLYVARELLKDDGVIFISIDDNEVSQLKLLCDSIFGEENFRNQIAVKRGAKSVQAQFESIDKLGISYEYILFYSKNANIRLPKFYFELDEQREGSWNNHWRGTDRPTMRYEIFGLNIEEGQWRWSKTRSINAIDNYNTLTEEIGLNPSQSDIDEWYLNNDEPDLLRLSTAGKPEHFVAPTNSKFGHNLWTDLMVGKSSSLANLGLKVFDNPKNPDLIIRMMKWLVEPNENEIVLDFFAGSGTTAHAVMQLNADDNGNRQFVTVQIDEMTKSNSKAFKAGYRTIFDITKERIIRASQKIREENPQATGDFGFKIYKTTPQLINHNIAFDLNQPELPELLELKPDDYLALLTTWRLYDGAKLTETVTDIDLDGYTAHLCQQNLYLMYPNFQPKHLIQLIKQLDNDPSFTPNRVVMLGETIDSSRQNEIYQALKDYANKKSLDLSVIVRNI